MAIRINKSGAATGLFDSLAYPFTLLSYIQIYESAAQNAIGFRISNDVDSPSQVVLISHDVGDDLKSFWIPDGQTAIAEVISNNPIDTDFSTWWAVMMSIKEDGITVAHNVWSGVGNSAVLSSGTITLNTLTGVSVAFSRAWIGGAADKFINVQEVVLIDKALTTGQLNLWAHGVPAPQANLPGNIVFYQPLVTGYNEPTSVGTVGQFDTGAFIVESVVGPVLMSIENNIDIVNGAISLQANYGQSDSDASGILSSSDSGALTYNLIYDEGMGLGAVGNIYHNNISVTSGAVQIIDLQVGAFDPVNLTFDRGMSRVKSITLENKSGTGDLYLDFSTINSSSVFRDMFGDPSGQINLPANSCYHINDGTNSGYIVDSNNSDLVVSGGSFFGTGTLFVTIMGDK